MYVLLLLEFPFFGGGKGRRIVYFSISLFYYLEKIFKMATLFVLDRYGCDYSSDISWYFSTNNRNPPFDFKFPLFQHFLRAYFVYTRILILSP